MKTNSTSQRIRNASRRLLDRGGLEAVTMRRVARAVGITPMAIYRYYPGRAGLLSALADEGFNELAALLTCSRSRSTTEDRLIEMTHIYLEHAIRSPRLFELMFLKPRVGARRYPRDFSASPTAKLMAEVVQEGIDSGWLVRDSVWEIVFEMGALSHGLIMLYVNGRTDIGPTRFRALYQRSFRRYIRGLKTPY